jgi:hypothetical protein
VPKDSPSKTLVNRFKQNLGGTDMLRTVSEVGPAQGGGSAMARVFDVRGKTDVVAFGGVSGAGEEEA